MSSILMVAPQPYFRPRGTPFSVLHRLRALLADGHQIHLLTYPFGEDIPMPGLTITRSQRPAWVRDVRIGPSVAKLFLDVQLYRLTARTLREQHYDVLHSHEEAAFFCQWLAERHGIRHIYDMHSSLPLQLDTFSKFNLWPLQQLFERLERRVLQRCDGVITICQELAEIADLYVGNRPHAMIENTADDAQVFGNGERSGIGAELKGKRVVLYTGTLETYQGLELLLGAMTRVRQEIPDAHLLLAGGTPDQVEAVRAQAESLGLGACTTLLGTVHPSVIPELYDLSDAIVSPRSRGTNTPLKIYSYLRSGKPIVATNLLTHTQTLSDRTACLVEATEAGLAAGIERVLSDPDLARSLVAAASDLAETEFADAAYLRKVQTLFREVVGGEEQSTGSARVAV